MRRLLCRLACLAALAVGWSCTAPPAPPRGSRVVLVAADGAGWPLLSPLLSSGELPHLARLYRAGAAGILRGEPPLSPAPAWTTVATGRPARDHGILFDAVLAPGTGMLRCATADQRRAAALWEIASAREITVGVADWPATWPAQPVRGFMIAEGFASETASTRGYQHPPAALGPGGAAGEGLELPDELEAAADLDPALAAAFDEDLASLSRALSLHRVHQPRLLMLRFRSIDAAAHLFWQYHDPGYLELAASRGERIDTARAARLKEAVRSACRLLDAWIGLLQERLPEDATLVVASGWGLRGVRMTDFLHVDLPGLLDRLGYGGSAATRLFVLPDTGRVPRAIYLRQPAAPPSGGGAGEGEALARRAANDLRALATESGAPLFREVHGASGSHHGAAIELFENREIEPLAAIRVGGSTVMVRDLFRRYGDGYAAHDPDGLLLAAGPGVAPGVHGWSAGVLDVAPTILGFLGLPASSDMPGRPIRELLGETETAQTIATWEGAWPLPLPSRREDDDARRAFDRLRRSGHLE